MPAVAHTEIAFAEVAHAKFAYAKPINPIIRHELQPEPLKGWQRL